VAIASVAVVSPFLTSQTILFALSTLPCPTLSTAAHEAISALLDILFAIKSVAAPAAKTFLGFAAIDLYTSVGRFPIPVIILLVPVLNAGENKEVTPMLCKVFLSIVPNLSVSTPDFCKNLSNNSTGKVIALSFAKSDCSLDCPSGVVVSTSSNLSSNVGGLMFSGAALEIATFGGYTFCFGFQEAAGLSFITDGLARTMYNAKDLSSFSAHNYKNNDFSIPTIDIPNDTYFPDTMEKRWIKKGRIDPTLPTDPFNDPNWEDDSHEEAKKSGHYRFKNKNTGKKIEFDRGKPGEPGHKGRDHYHRPNPNAKNKYDSYLDEKGNPVPNKSDPSHLYPPKWQ